MGKPRATDGTIVLLSMGYDSLCAWHLLGRPSAVYFDIGTPYAPAEMERYERLRDTHPQLLPVQDIRWLGPRARADAWVPLRNLVLSVNAAALGYNDVVLAAATDWATDKRMMFTLTTTLAMKVAEPGGRFRVRRPFQRWTKTRLIRETPQEVLDAYAYSCFEGTEPVCGRCHACRRASLAHLAAGRVPPTYPPPGLSRTGLVSWLRDRRRRLHIGEAVCAPLRAHEVWQAWRAYRKLPESVWTAGTKVSLEHAYSAHS